VTDWLTDRKKVPSVCFGDCCYWLDAFYKIQTASKNEPNFFWEH